MRTGNILTRMFGRCMGRAVVIARSWMRTRKRWGKWRSASKTYVEWSTNSRLVSGSCRKWLTPMTTSSRISKNGLPRSGDEGSVTAGQLILCRQPFRVRSLLTRRKRKTEKGNLSTLMRIQVRRSTQGFNPSLSFVIARSASSVSVPIPGRFPDDISPLRIIEDDKFIVPPVEGSPYCGLEKENEVPIQVPTPVPSPMLLRGQAVRRSPCSLQLGRDTSPYVLRSVLFSGSRTSGRPIVHPHQSTYSRQHRVGKIAPSSSRPGSIGSRGCNSGELDTWGFEYGPSPSDFDQERGDGSVAYDPRLVSAPGCDVAGIAIHEDDGEDVGEDFDYEGNLNQ